MATLRNPDRSGIIAYMASIGLDASQISDEDWTRHGYYELLPGYDEDGYRRRVWRQWPESFDFNTMLNYYR